MMSTSGDRFQMEEGRDECKCHGGLESLSDFLNNTVMGSFN